MPILLHTYLCSSQAELKRSMDSFEHACKTLSEDQASIRTLQQTAAEREALAAAREAAAEAEVTEAERKLAEAAGTMRAAVEKEAAQQQVHIDVWTKVKLISVYVGLAL